MRAYPFAIPVLLASSLTWAAIGTSHFECVSVSDLETAANPDIRVTGTRDSQGTVSTVELFFEDLDDGTFHSFLKRVAVRADSAYQPAETKMNGFRRYDLSERGSDDLFEIYLPAVLKGGGTVTAYFTVSFDQGFQSTRELTCSIR